MFKHFKPISFFFAELVPATFGAADDGEDQTGGASGSSGGIGHSGLGPTSPNDDSLGGVGGGGPPSGGGKISKAAVLQRSIEYIHFTQVRTVIRCLGNAILEADLDLLYIR